MSKKPVPMVCVVCKHTPGSYYGRLVFPEELVDGAVPECPNHTGKSMKYPLTAVNRNISG